VEQAKYFADAGVKRIHIVDLDAAKGQGNNRSWIQKIRQAVPCVLEVGGGIRTEADVRELLDLGIQRLVIGTMFIRVPDTVSRWVDQYGRLFLAGIDARGGIVRVSGWQEGTEIADSEAALLASKMGMLGIIYTNIDRDGTLKGPDAARALQLAELSSLPVILSGGVSSQEDIHQVTLTSANAHSNRFGSKDEYSGKPHRQPNHGIVGIIIGKAYYEGKINLEEILSKYPQPVQMPW